MNEHKSAINGIVIDLENDLSPAGINNGRSLILAVKVNEDGAVYIAAGRNLTETGKIAPWPARIEWVADPDPETIMAKLAELGANEEEIAEAMTDYNQFYEIHGITLSGVTITSSPIKAELGTAPAPIEWKKAAGRYLVIDGYGDNELSPEEYNEMTADLSMAKWLTLDREANGYKTDEEQFEALKAKGYNVEMTEFGYII